VRPERLFCSFRTPEDYLFGSGMKIDFVHSSGHLPVSQMSLHSACNSLRVISPPFLNSSAGMSSGPAALPFSVIAIALAISDFSGGGSLSSVSKGADSWSSYVLAIFLPTTEDVFCFCQQLSVFCTDSLKPWFEGGG